MGRNYHFSSPPYQTSIEVNTLHLKWNRIFARVKDTAGNYAAESTFIYRLMPAISLDTPEGSRGTEVIATGSGWLPEDPVIISLGDSQLGLPIAGISKILTVFHNLSVG
jgi:hypothetical protein